MPTPWEIAQNQAMAQAQAKKQAAEQSRIAMFMEWLRKQTTRAQQTQKPQQSAPAGSYLVSAETRRNQLDEAFR